MMYKPRLPVLLIVMTLIAVYVAGCGGGSGGGDPQTTGSATLTILWPTPATQIAVPESAKITITNGDQTVAEHTVNRPTDVTASLVDIQDLPAGTFTVTVTAYPLINAGGSPISQVSSQLVIQTGSDTKLSFSTDAAVDRVVVTAPSTTLAANSSIKLTATPETSEGVAVLVPAGSITWDSANDSIASVDSTGTVTAHSPGDVDITATESTSGQSGSLTITVPAGKWTVMVYMGADNNLAPFGVQDINEMESVGSTSNVNVVVQADHNGQYDYAYSSWYGARRYLITKDNDLGTIHSTLIQDMGNTNMASPQTLINFIQWATTSYPADHYLLVIWDHGRGWRTGTQAIELNKAPMKSVCYDETSGDEMSLAELAQALGAAHHSDVVFFDACLMGMVEVAHAIRNSADVMVASEESVPANGEPYNTLLSHMNANPQMTAQTLGQVITDDYIASYSSYDGPVTMAALNLQSIDQLTSAADQLSDAIVANMSQVRSGVRTAQSATQHFDNSTNPEYTYYRDLYDFARLVNTYVANTAVQSAAQGVMSAVSSTVIREGHRDADVAYSHGISVYLPNPGSMVPQYTGTTFAQATSWDDMLSQY